MISACIKSASLNQIVPHVLTSLFAKTLSEQIIINILMPIYFIAYMLPGFVVVS